ncbi:MAG: ribose 5-phosphate isomerase B [Thermoanaerobaculales bacterium]|nr:ribose 5-phosphate isomerase B [Thermoanaerobaculales bacterium]
MILLASDHAAVNLRRSIAEHVVTLGFDVQDLGVEDGRSVDYPDFAHELAEKIAHGQADRGILICGTGLGMSITANRHPGVRAALCHDAYTAEMARRHNDANILCMGSRVLGLGVAEQIASVFLKTAFEGGRHQRRVDKIEI